MNSCIVFKTIYLEKNQGHGNARRISLDNASNELVALMDADDVASYNRFEKQLELFKNNNIDVCGGNITEFEGEESNIIGRRKVELTDAYIKKDMKKRCPMNQVTVMFKKSAYNLAGGYIDWYCEEDYYLWARMAINNCVFANVDENIVNVRVGLDMSSRRGGWKYFKSEKKMQKFLLKSKITSFPRYFYNVMIRFGGEIILPNFLRNKAFKMMRSKYDNKEKNVKEEIPIKNSFQNFSVAMCVYGGDNPKWFDRALESIIINQSIKPTEVVLVIDGPISSEHEDVINKYRFLCNKTQ